LKGVGAVCTAKLKEKETAKFDGAFVDPECGTTYFCSGRDLATDDKVQYDACKEEERATRCTAALGTWKSSGPNGQFTENGCTTMWKCNSVYYTNQADYDASSCGCTWVDETYQSGTTTKSVQTGTTQGPCEKSIGRICLKYSQIPVYENIEIPAYSTRKVCKKL